MTTTTTTTLDNPMWEQLARWVHDGDKNFYEPSRLIGRSGDLNGYLGRHEYTSQWAWTVTAPNTVAFVAEHLGPKVIDPLAGSGYWAYLLTQLGADVIATDLNPSRAGTDANHWHRHGSHTYVLQFDAVEAVKAFSAGRSLLLSWPPYSSPIGEQAVAAFAGDRIVYIGEGEGGCCGDDGMFALFESEWTEVAQHEPVQFWGLHDYVHVYDRKPEAETP